MDSGLGPIPKKTSKEMYTHMMEAEETKEPVEGFKGFSPVIALYFSTIALMLACDLAHNMKVLFKHIIKLLKGKRKMAKYVKPEYSQKIKDEYLSKNISVPASIQKDLVKRLELWEKKCSAQQKVEQVVCACVNVCEYICDRSNVNINVTVCEYACWCVHVRVCVTSIVRV